MSADVIDHTNMPMSSWAHAFAAQAEEQESIRMFRHTGASRCPGGWDSDTGDWDPMQDRQYHTDNPLAEQCVNGIVGESVIQETWKVFVAHELEEQQRRDLGYGVIEDNNLVIFVPVNYSFSETRAGISGNVRRAEFPIGSGRYYRVENPDVWMFQDSPLYRYALLVVEDEGAGIGLVPGMDD